MQNGVPSPSTPTDLVSARQTKHVPNPFNDLRSTDMPLEYHTTLGRAIAIHPNLAVEEIQ